MIDSCAELSIIMRLIKNCLEKSWFSFVLFATILFVQCILFHYSCFHYVAISSLWTAPREFVSFYVTKLFPACFIASFIFVTKNRWWVLVVSVLIDVWLIANIIYYRANDFFLDLETISIVGNLEGFEDSIAMYLNLSILEILICTIPLVLIIRREKQRHLKKFFFMIGIAICLLLYDLVLGFSTFKETNENVKDGWKYNVFKTTNIVTSGNYFQDQLVFRQWIESQTPIHLFFAYPYYELSKIYHDTDSKYELTKSDINELVSYVNTASCQQVVNQNLIIILGESFESWVFNFTDLDGHEIVPNLNKFGQCSNSVFFNKIRCQTLKGNSGDGQMIINTGLLPISSGAACMLFGTNIFPNIAHNWNNSTIINPAHNVWNQSIVTYSYGYHYLVENPKVNEWEKYGDRGVINRTCSVIDTIKKPFCIMPITVSTHSPFKCKERSCLNFPEDMPEQCRDYLNCMHYADSCLGILLEKLERDSLLANTTIVITGDHTIFKSSMLREFQSFAKKYNYSIPTEESYCPLIIYSPSITEHLDINEICYQMDIFPTILHCIGADEYYWKGFGVNLLDSTARHNRKITEEEAFRLSNKMIRGNFFKKYLDSLP